MRCDIIIPVWNQLEFTKGCIDSLTKNTNYPYRLIIIDNGSDDETRRYLEGVKNNRLDDVILIHNENNVGFIKAVNQALRIADSPYICILNNDTIPAPGWLERMIEFAEAHEDVGLINPQCGGHGNMPIDIYAGLLRRHKGEYMEMNQCQGFCMLLRKSLVDEIGLLDESFGIGGYDDTDYSMRAHKAGHRCVATSDSYVYHRLHGSFNHSGDREKWVAKNRAIYYNKWGKHLRVGLILTLDSMDTGALSKVIKFAYGLMREWSWVHIWINNSRSARQVSGQIGDILSQNGLAPHQNLRTDFFRLNDLLFQLVISGKLLERMRGKMKDKRFDALIMFNGAFSGPLAKTMNIVKTESLRFDLNEPDVDWQRKGAETALLIKAKGDSNGRRAV